MFNRLARNRRSLLIIGAALAVAAFALVVLLLNQTASKTPTAAPIPTLVATIPPGPGTVIVPPTATVVTGEGVGPSEVTVIHDVPSGTKLSDIGSLSLYFKTQPAVGALPQNAITSTDVLATDLVSNTVQMLTTVKRGTVLTADAFQLLPFSPPGSISYQVRVGRVAESVSVPLINADNGGIVSGDFVNVLLTLHDRDLSAATANSPDPANNGPIQTQELLPDIRVIDATPTGMYTLELTPQQALLIKYVKDYGGSVDLVLMSATDVKSQAAQPKTNAVVPNYFLTPVTLVKGTPQGNGVLFPFTTPIPTPTATVTR